MIFRQGVFAPLPMGGGKRGYLLLLLAAALLASLLNAALLPARRASHRQRTAEASALRLTAAASRREDLTSSCTISPRRPHVLVYNRLEKTGSTTLHLVIDALAARNGFTHVRLPARDFYNGSAARAAIRAALRRPQRSLVSEHFAFPGALGAAADDARVSYMQVLRAPTARCVSWYYWSRFSWDNPWTAGNRRRFGNATLDACLASAGGGGGAPPLPQLPAPAPGAVLLRRKWGRVL